MSSFFARIWIWIYTTLVAEAERVPKLNGNITLQTTRRLRTRKELQGSDGGEWAASTHLFRYGFNIDSGLLTLLARACETAERRNAQRVSGTGLTSSCKAIEFGCGIGIYADYLKSQGTRDRVVVGMEPEPMGGVFGRPDGPVQSTVNILNLDVTEYPRLVTALGGPFQLVYSIEVAEHIPSDRHADVAAWLFAAADPKGSTLIFSAGHPGQKGTGHIGNRNRADWRTIHEAAGWVMDERGTFDAMRAVDARRVNHRKNIMVLTRNLNSGGSRAQAASGAQAEPRPVCTLLFFLAVAIVVVERRRSSTTTGDAERTGPPCSCPRI